MSSSRQNGRQQPELTQRPLVQDVSASPAMKLGDKQDPKIQKQRPKQAELPFDANPKQKTPVSTAEPRQSKQKSSSLREPQRQAPDVGASKVPPQRKASIQTAADKEQKIKSDVDDLIKKVEAKAIAAMTEALPKADIERLRQILASDDDALKDVQAALNSILKLNKKKHEKPVSVKPKLAPKTRLVERLKSAPPVEDSNRSKAGTASGKSVELSNSRMGETTIDLSKRENTTSAKPSAACVEQFIIKEKYEDDTPPDWRQLYDLHGEEISPEVDQEELPRVAKPSQNVVLQPSTSHYLPFSNEQRDILCFTNTHASAAPHTDTRPAVQLPVEQPERPAYRQIETTASYDSPSLISPWFGGTLAGIVGGLGLASVVGGVILFLSLQDATSDKEADTARTANYQSQGTVSESENGNTIQSAASGVKTSATSNGATVSAAAMTKDAGHQNAQIPYKLTGQKAKGPSDQPIKLTLSIHDLDPTRATVVRFIGLPPGAKLSGGFNVGGGAWLVPRDKIGGLTLAVPHYFSGTFPLKAQVLASDAVTPLSKVRTFEVQIYPSDTVNDANQLAASNQPTGGVRQVNSAAPTNAQTENNQKAGEAKTEQPAPSKAKEPAAKQSIKAAALQPSSADNSGQATQQPTDERSKLNQKLQTGTLTVATLNAADASAGNQDIVEIDPNVRKGQEMLRTGKVTEARKLFRKLADQGNPDAALALARSYDPVYFEQRKIPIKSADAKKALLWYREAIARGKSDAEQRIDQLLTWIQK